MFAKAFIPAPKGRMLTISFTAAEVEKMLSGDQEFADKCLNILRERLLESQEETNECHPFKRYRGRL